MRERAVLVMTASLSAIDCVRTSPPLVVVARSIMRSSMCARPFSACSSDRYNSGSVTSVRKPRLPKLTPRIGMPEPASAMQSAMPISVPSPPSTRTMSTSVARADLSRTIRPSRRRHERGGRRFVDRAGRRVPSAIRPVRAGAASRPADAPSPGCPTRETGGSGIVDMWCVS